MQWLIDLLFWPWFRSVQYKEWPSLISVQQAAILILFLLVVLLAVRLGPLKRRLSEEGWPRFFQEAVKLFFAVILIGLAGGMLNIAAMFFNGDKTPVAVQTYAEFVSRSRHGMDGSHTLASADTNFFVLVDYIKVNSSELCLFLFPSSSYASPGDILLAAGVIFSWWTALAICGWAIMYSSRRVFKRVFKI